jgi:hypothetical protein
MSAAGIGRRRRARLTPSQRRERFAATCEKWAATLTPAQRAEFDRLLDESDELIDRDWELRRGAFAIARQHIKGAE